MQGKSHRPGAGRNYIPNTRNTHIPSETQLRSQQGYHPVQAVMMQGQRQGAYLAGHPMAMQPRSMRPTRAIYSSSPQGHSPMQGYIQQQNMQYQVVGQDPYGQPVMRPTFIPNVQPAYQMQPTTAPFQPQYHPQQHQYYNQGMSPMYYAVQPNQPIQPQQLPQPSNPTIQTNNLTKPKPKRTHKIVIRDLKNNKDATEQILSHTNAANGRTGSTPPLTNSTAQTESSTIQAQFVARFAARVGGEKCKQDNEKKPDETDKNKQLQERTDHEIRTEVNKQGNGSIAANETHAKDLPPNNMETLNKVNSSAVENWTDSPKNTTDNTHLNQGSQTLQEMAEKLKKNMKSDGRESTIKSGASEKKETATEISDKVPENNVNTAEGKTSNENMVNPCPVEQIKSDNKDSLDNAQNGVENTIKSLDSEAAHAGISSDKTGKKVEAISDSKEVVGQQPTQTSNPTTHTLTKLKPKRTSKIVIRDPQMLEHSLSKGRWL